VTCGGGVRDAAFYLNRLQLNQGGISRQQIPMQIGIITTATLAPWTSDLKESAERLGLGVGIEEQESGGFASIPWWLPTAVVLNLTRSYFETMASEAAGDPYPAIKPALQRLFKRLAGESREVRMGPTGTSMTAAKMQGPEYDALSVMVELCSGQRAKFLIPCDLPEAEHEAAIDAMHRLMIDHYAGSPNDALTLEVTKLMRASRPVLLRFAASASAWSVWAPALRPPL
jgi:hypothetical protein